MKICDFCTLKTHWKVGRGRAAASSIQKRRFLCACCPASAHGMFPVETWRAPARRRKERGGANARLTFPRLAACVGAAGIRGPALALDQLRHDARQHREEADGAEETGGRQEVRAAAVAPSAAALRLDRSATDGCKRCAPPLRHALEDPNFRSEKDLQVIRDFKVASAKMLSRADRLVGEPCRPGSLHHHRIALIPGRPWHALTPQATPVYACRPRLVWPSRPRRCRLT